MKLISILLCLTLMSTIETTALSIIFKPKLNKPTTPDRAPLQVMARKLPEERRKLPIFPKSSKKFVIKFESPVNENINIRLTKRPLMKKITFLSKETSYKNDIIDTITNSPVTTSKPFNVNMLDMSQKQDSTVKDKEDSPEVIQEDSSENNEINDIGVEEESQTEWYPINEEVNANRKLGDNKIKKRVLEGESASFGDEDEEMADWKEFIFLKDGNLDKYSNIDDLSVTTVEPVKRIIRSDNVIEEENLVTTPSVHKFTWIDTRLTNDLTFKNIHS